MRVFYFYLKLFLVVTVSFPAVITYGQPQPCADPPVMTSFCNQACIICNIDGYTGRNGSGGKGEAPPGFCTTYLHNAKWIAFIAGSTDLKIRLSVSNCNMNRGLELGIYEGIDCDNYRLVSNCRGGANDPVAPNTSAVFQNVVPLTIGQYYYIVMDGSGGSVCDWTFEVLEGSTQVMPLNDSGVLSGPDEVCLGEPDHFSTSGETGATIYEWTVDGEPMPDKGINVSLTFPVAGEHQLCCTASNACDEAPPSCKQVFVRPQQVTHLEATICEGSSYVVDGQHQLTSAGNYEFLYKDQNGCDSVLSLQLTSTNVTTADISASICEGDSLYVGGIPFFQPGRFSITISNSLGCDSLINLDLTTVVCEMKGASDVTDVSCYGYKDGRLRFLITDGSAPFSYRWEKLNSNINGTGHIDNSGEEIILTGLSTGTYLVTIADNFGNDVILSGTVLQPDPLFLSADLSDHSGYNISCYGGADGRIDIAVAGGKGPMSYQWSTGASTAGIASLSAGDYEVTITDANGCALIQVINVNQAPEMSFSVDKIDPDCSGPATGSVSVRNVQGGIMPYKYKMGYAESSNNVFTGVAEGQYMIFVTDGNGCKDSARVELNGKIIPEVDAGRDRSILLSEEVQLDAEVDASPDQIVWLPSAGLSCDDCLDPVARPYTTTTYLIRVTSHDGCVDEDSLTVRVEERRRVFVPNAFTPNEDGVNDLLAVFAGDEVAEIRSFRIFSRWGALIYEARNYKPSGDIGWNGYYRDKMVESGVFAWAAEVLFLDGATLLYKGDVTVIR